MPSSSTPASSLGERLQDVTEALAGARTQEDVFGVVLPSALGALGAVAGTVLLVAGAGDQLEVAAMQGRGEGAQTVWQDGPLDSTGPAGDALGRREALFFEREGELGCAYPGLETRTGGVAAAATAVLPLFLDQRPLGAVILDFREPHVFTAAETRFLRTLAAQGAIALGRVRLLTDLTARVEARTRELEAARQGAEVLARLGDALQRAASPGEVALGTLGPALGARGMGLVRLEGEHIRDAAFWGEVPGRVRALLTGPGLRLADLPPLLEEDGAAEPIRTPGGTLVGFVVAWRPAGAGPWEEGQRELRRRAAVTLGLALERLEAVRRLEEERAALDAFVAYKEAVGGRSDVPTLAWQAVEVVRANLAHVSAVYYERDGELWKGAGVVRRRGARGRGADHGGGARGGAELRPGGGVGAAGVRGRLGRPGQRPPQRRGLRGRRLPAPGGARPDARPLRGGHAGARTWTEREQALVRAVVRGLTVTLERTEHLRQLEEERAALAAFARFTEASTRATDPLALAREASAVLQATLNVQVGYSELEGGLWKGRVFSETTPPGEVAQGRRGFPAELPRFARPFETRGVVFVDGWDAGAEGADHTGVYRAAALYPYFEDGEPHGLLTMGSPAAHTWTERERSVFRAVGRSLALAFERAEAARRLTAQNAELEARTRALEAFAALTRDLSPQGDPAALIRRALEVALSLLPDGCGLYYEPEGEVWRVRAQVGQLRDPALQAAVDAGLPFAQTHNLLLPWTSGQPLYQDHYDRDTDGLGDLTRGVGATATLPLRVGGENAGIFAVALSGAHVWSATDRAVLETAVRHLGLALEGARAQRELSRTQHYLRVVAENAPLLLFATDPRGVFTLSEGSLLGRLGLRPGEAVGRQATALFAHEPDLRGGRRLNRALAGEETHDLTHFASRGVTLETWFTPVRNEAGEVTEVVGVALDVTERLEVQRRVEQANEELRRSNAELEQFAYVASHDLQAPIRAVTSFAGVIDRRYGAQLDDRGRLYLRQIVEGGEHMKRLVDDLLAFSRVHTQQRELEPVDSAAVFGAVVGRLNAETLALGASVTRGELPRVLADGPQLDQLLQNLISNGLKYRREGVVPRVRITAEQAGRMWRFAVRDNGIGIEEQYFERIFVIFQRLHGRERYEGTGIGLAVCKKIVERHGGQLWLESTLGQGSTFYFTLPGV